MHFHAGDGRQWIDTYMSALTVWPDAPAHNNQTLRYWLGIQSPTFDRNFAMPPHRALLDAYVTAHILVQLMSRRSVSELVAISEKPTLLNKLNFGKRRGMKFSDAPAVYLQWIRDKSELNEEVTFSAAYWLQKRRQGQVKQQILCRASKRTGFCVGIRRPVQYSENII
jgi:exodeoxyribonuclease X